MTDTQTEAFYREHWRNIEPERLARYERMFSWRPEQQALLERLRLASHHRVLDFGCGPGFVTLEIARCLTAANGHAYGVDLNTDFVRAATARADEAGLSERVTYIATDDGLPIPTASLDRALCKNVLEYVPDAQATLRDIFAALKPGGMLHVSDSDWGFLVVEPWTPDEVRTFFGAAAGAFREPYIGRRLNGLLVRAGFVQIQVEIVAGADREGRLRPVLQNMAGYARELGGMPEATTTALLARVDAAIASGEFLAVLPQFAITAFKP